jgi:hypothetical protein
MKSLFLAVLFTYSFGYSQHSDLILREQGSVDMGYTQRNFGGNKIFNDAYDISMILQTRFVGGNPSGFYEYAFIVDPNWNRVVYGRQAYDSNGNPIYSGYFPNYKYDWWVKAYGTLGSGDGNLNSPRGISVVRYDNTQIDVYVADTGNNRIVKLRVNSETGYVTWIRTYTAGFNQPYDVSVGDNNNTDPNDDLIWVADKNNHRVVQLDQNGNVVYSIGSFGYGQGKFNLPVSISIGKYWNETYSNIVRVAEQGYNLIISFKTGQAPNGYTFWYQYLFPNVGKLTSIESDPAGVGYYVVENSSNKIHKFRDINGTGFYLGEFGTFGTELQQLYYPNSISLEKILQIGSSYWGGFYAGVLERWSENAGAKYFEEGVDIVDFYATPNSDGSIRMAL